METQAIFEAALRLPEKERTVLAERLLESLPPEPETLDEGEFCDELERRFTEFAEGRVAGREGFGVRQHKPT